MLFISKLKQKINNNSFVKSVLTLSSGIAIGQLINLLGLPIISRLYSPEDIGAYTVITTNSAIISSIACLGMMTTILLPKSDDEARGLAQLVTKATMLLTSCACIIFLCISNYYKFIILDDFSYGYSLALMWIHIVSTTIASISYSYANRLKLYKVMFWNPILNFGFNMIFRIILFYLGFGSLGYILGSYMATLITIIHLFRKSNPYKKVENIEFKNLRLLKNYTSFPKYQLPANLISSVASRVPIQMILTLFGEGVLGSYSMCLRIIALPTTFLATPINKVFFREASKLHREGGDVGKFAFDILKANIKIAIIPVCVLTIFGEELFVIFLGENWRIAGQFASILCISEIMKFCSMCLSGGLVIIGYKHVNLALSIINVVINYGMYAIAMLLFNGNLVGTLYIVMISSSVYSIITIGAFFYCAKDKIISIK